MEIKESFNLTTEIVMHELLLSREMDAFKSPAAVEARYLEEIATPTSASKQIKSCNDLPSEEEIEQCHCTVLSRSERHIEIIETTLKNLLDKSAELLSSYYHDSLMFNNISILQNSRQALMLIRGRVAAEYPCYSKDGTRCVNNNDSTHLRFITPGSCDQLADGDEANRKSCREKAVQIYADEIKALRPEVAKMYAQLERSYLGQHPKMNWFEIDEDNSQIDFFAKNPLIDLHMTLAGNHLDVISHKVISDKVIFYDDAYRPMSPPLRELPRRIEFSFHEQESARGYTGKYYEVTWNLKVFKNYIKYWGDIYKFSNNGEKIRSGMSSFILKRK